MQEQKTSSLRLNKDDVVYQQWDTDVECMYDIRCGSIGLFESYGTPDQTLLAELVMEDFFGEMDMIEGTPRSHTAVALEDGTELIPITAETFRSYFSTRPAKVLLIMQNLSRRTRELTKRYIGLCRKIYNDHQKQ